MSKVVNNTGSVRLNSSDRFRRYNANRFSVSGDILPYARATSIYFDADGLKPNKRYYPFFNGIYVGKYCIADQTIDGEVVASTPSISSGLDDVPITSDRFGRIRGVFFLPDNMFLVGRHKFMLVDAINNTSSSYILPSSDSVSASAIYEVDGLYKNKSLGVMPDSKIDTRAEVTSPGSINSSIPPITCEMRYFEYIISKSESRLFSISSNTQDPPNPTTVRPDFGDSSKRYSVTYVSSTVVKPGIEYRHIYSASTVGSSNTASRIYRQEWVGLSGVDISEMPSLFNFRPSGLSDDSVVTIVTPWTVVGPVACPINLGFGEPITGATDKFDPVAQSFFIRSNQYPSGVLVSSIRLYFKSVDQNSPVTVEIRDMDGSIPGSFILPNGSCTLPGVAVVGSDDSSVSTIFKFNGLVYLAPDKEYCFVVKTPSLGYSMWFSRVGSQDVLTGRVVDATSFDGTLFKNDNNSSWIPDLYEDIKFDLNVAAFDTTARELHLRPRVFSPNGVANFHVGGFFNLPLHNISTSNGSNEVIIRIPDHGLNNGDFVTISSVAPGLTINGIDSSILNDDHAVISVIDKDRVVVRLPSSVIADRNGPLRASFSRPEIRVIPQDSPKDNVVSGVLRFIGDTSMSPAIAPSGDLEVINQPSLPQNVVFSNSFNVQTNFRIDEALIDYIGFDVDNKTSIIEEILTLRRNSAGSFVSSGSYTTVGNRFSPVMFSNSPAYLLNPKNETKYSNNSLSVRMRFGTRDKYVSPMVDVSTAALVAKSYRINNQFDQIDNIFNSTPDVGELKSKLNDVETNSEIGRKSGFATAKYKSPISSVITSSYRTILLNVMGVAPQGSYIDAYVRTSSDYNTHEDHNWEWMPLNGDYMERFVGGSPTEIKKWVYEVTLNDGFTAVDFKLVLRSATNSIPKIHGIQSVMV